MQLNSYFYEIRITMDFNKDKRKAFHIPDQELCHVAKAISHPIRINLLRFISRHSGCNFSDISNAFKYYAPSSLSQHLKILRLANLLICQYNGVYSKYTVDSLELSEFHKKVSAFYKEINNNFFKEVSNEIK